MSSKNDRDEVCKVLRTLADKIEQWDAAEQLDSVKWEMDNILRDVTVDALSWKRFEPTGVQVWTFTVAKRLEGK